MLNRGGSSDEDYDAELYCTKVSAALEARLGFGSRSRESSDQGAGSVGVAKHYTTFYVESCEDDPFSDDYEFSGFCCEVSDPTPLEQATPTKVDAVAGTVDYGCGPGTTGADSAHLVLLNSDDDDDGWNSEPENVLPLATSCSGEP